MWVRERNSFRLMLVSSLSRWVGEWGTQEQRNPSRMMELGQVELQVSVEHLRRVI